MGSSPKTSVTADESRTHGLANWWRVSSSSRTIGMATPSPRWSQWGMADTFGAGAPASTAISSAICR
ncbi:MAG: hypothetical protein U5K29_08230 [Acidimicrobiales bacterium]|nr:hypothetical protein [Acidimicrobiales bacterium]